MATQSGYNPSRTDTLDRCIAALAVTSPATATLAADQNAQFALGLSHYQSGMKDGWKNMTKTSMPELRNFMFSMTKETTIL